MRIFEPVQHGWDSFYVLSRYALRLFKRLPKDVQARIISEAQVLKTQPLSGQPLKGEYPFLRSLHFSYKGTAYRIIYQAISETSTIVIRLAGSRENLYYRLKEMRIKPLELKQS